MLLSITIFVNPWHYGYFPKIMEVVDKRRSNSGPITCAERAKEGVREPPVPNFHGDNTGSNPVGDANNFNNLIDAS